jgi:hypothetical protein
MWVLVYNYCNKICDKRIKGREVAGRRSGLLIAPLSRRAIFLHIIRRLHFPRSPWEGINSKSNARNSNPGDRGSGSNTVISLENAAGNYLPNPLPIQCMEYALMYVGNNSDRDRYRSAVEMLISAGSGPPVLASLQDPRVVSSGG